MSEQVNLPVLKNSTGLINYDAALYYLTESHKIDEVKNFRDQAKALEAICKVANNLDAERLAREIRIRAERKAGQLLKTMVKAQGKRTDLNLVDKHDQVETLSDMGISKDQSSTWQKLADVPDELFEEEVTSDIPSTGGIIMASRPVEVVPQIGRTSLRIWGKLRAFERQEDELCDVVETYDGMTDTMQADVRRLAPRAIEFWQHFVKENML